MYFELNCFNAQEKPDKKKPGSFKNSNLRNTVISATADAFRGHGFSLLVTAKTCAPAVTRRKDTGQTKFGQCLSCGAFSSCYSRRSRRLRSNQLVL
jgi:hypothetical protein